MSSGYVPQAEGFVPASRESQAAVDGEVDGADPVGVAVECPHTARGFELPEAEGSIAASGEAPEAVGAEGDGANVVGVAFEGLHAPGVARLAADGAPAEGIP